MKMYGPYDVMHIHTSIQSGIALCVAKSSKISKRVCHAHTNSIQRSTSKISKIFLTPLFRYLIHIAATDRVACSDMAGKFLYKKDKFEILKNGIDLQKFEKITDEEVSILRSTLSNDGKYYLVGHVGRFSDMKNQDFILKIASKFKNKNIKFIFVGDGDNFEIIKNKAVESNINVEFLGRRDDIPVIMSAIDLLLLPSLPGEGFPVTLVEAQATGCPCVVSNNVTAEADLGMGLVQFYDLDDERAWENYIDKTPNLRKLRKESIECVRTLEFDKKTVALNWMKVYNGN
jgi:glycosyltransferase EpsF